MAHARFSDATVEAARSMPLLLAVQKLGFSCVEEDFKPRVHMGSRLFTISDGDSLTLLLITGVRWYDMNAKKGGGGAIDLAMHLRKVSFRQAVKLLLTKDETTH